MPAAAASASAPGPLPRAIADTPVASWSEEEVSRWGPQAADTEYGGRALEYAQSFSKFNPTPGTGRTGFTAVPPNNYPFYGESERYMPVMQADGGQLSEWQAMYTPSKEQAEEDRARAYAAGVPHGYVAPGDKYRDEASIDLWVVSELHGDEEYGDLIDAATGRHSGGPFCVRVSPKMRVEELRRVIRDAGGVIPALQKLSYAGKHLDDSQRTLEHYGIAYWHARFPHWPIKIRRY